MLIALFFCMIMSCSRSPVKPERDEVTIIEDITEDTVWESGKDFLVVGRVAIDVGVRLYIEGDVTISFKNKNSILEIYGFLIGNGRQENMNICFKVAEEQETDRMQKALNAFEGAEIKLNYCKFDAFLVAVKSYGSRLEINNSSFENCNRAIYSIRADTCVISDSNFRNNNNDVVFEQALHKNVKNYEIVDCNFTNAKLAGVMLTNNCFATVRNNLFTACCQGILIEHHSNSVITQNSFLNCETGLFFSYQYGVNSEVTMNMFENSDCSIGLFLSWPTVTNNNFSGNTGLNISSMHNPSVLVNAKNNWWGSIVEEDIKRSIYDKNSPNATDNSGLVEYVPFLTSALKDAGAIKSENIVD